MTRTGELETRSADVAARKSIRRHGRRPSVSWILLFLAAFAALGFVAWAMISRTSSIPTLVGALVILGAILALMTLRAAISTYAAGSRGAGGTALFMALIGGGAAIGAGLSFASAYILAAIGG